MISFSRKRFSILYIRGDYPYDEDGESKTFFEKTFEDVTGFFEASLCHNYSVTPISVKRFLDLDPSEIKSTYSAILLNYKFLHIHFPEEEKTFLDILSKIDNIPRLLYVHNDKSTKMPPDSYLNIFDLVFKREPFLEKDYYSLKQENKDKIISTSLPILPYLKDSMKLKARYDKIRCGSYPKTFDVNFHGKSNNGKRAYALKKLVGQDFSFNGGLYHDRTEISYIDEEISCERTSELDYLENIKRSKVCLAIGGHGGFTFRHLEIWYVGTFMLSDPMIRYIELPFKVEEGVHYVAYENYEDMLEKIRYYLANPEEREAIAMRGQKNILKNYTFKAYSSLLRKQIDEVIF